MTSAVEAAKAAQVAALTEITNEHNALVGKVNAVVGSKDDLTESILASEEMAELREAAEKAQALLDEAVEAKVSEALANKDTDVSDLQEKIKELKSSLTAGLKFFAQIYGKEAADALPKVERVKGSRASTGGGGGRRIRGYGFTVTIGDDSEDFESLSDVAKYLDLENVTTKVLQEQFFAKAGTDKLKEAPETVEFSLSYTDTDEQGNETPVLATITGTRKEEAKPAGVSDAKAEAEANLAETQEAPSFAPAEASTEDQSNAASDPFADPFA